MNVTMDFSWMAWTWPTATFFLVIAAMLVGMTLWEWAVPGGSPRYGVLGIETTRGDRFFVSLLGSAFICLAWLGAIGPVLAWIVASIGALSPELGAMLSQLGISGTNLWWALALCLVWALGVFRWV